MILSKAETLSGNFGKSFGNWEVGEFVKVGLKMAVAVRVVNFGKDMKESADDEDLADGDKEFEELDRGLKSENAKMDQLRK